MAAMNLPLITWCIVVAAMTVLISVHLFKKEQSQMQPRRQSNLIAERSGKRTKGYFRSR